MRRPARTQQNPVELPNRVAPIAALDRPNPNACANIFKRLILDIAFAVRRERAQRSEPRERSEPTKRLARERVRESEGRSPSGE
jgi:hypothetical protein